MYDTLKSSVFCKIWQRGVLGERGLGWPWSGSDWSKTN